MLVTLRRTLTTFLSPVSSPLKFNRTYNIGIRMLGRVPQPTNSQKVKRQKPKMPNEIYKEEIDKLTHDHAIRTAFNEKRKENSKKQATDNLQNGIDNYSNKHYE